MRARSLLPLLAGAGLLAAAPAAVADYHRTDLISDQPGHAMLTDPDLVNAWGLAAGPTTPLWVADNGTDKATLYSNGGGTGMPSKISALVVDVSGGAPTGQVFNDTTAFGGASFLFSSETGKITAWSTGKTADVVAKRRRAVYKGLTLAGARLYATDFRHGRVDVWNGDLHRVRHPGFRDRRIPHGYAPFGIKAIGARIIVTYAKQDAEGEDDVAGRGHGFVDAFSRTGHLRKRLVRHGRLNSPWGLVKAPSGFGRFSGDLLVGNFGNGAINAYSARSGRFRGALRADRKPLRIEGLWDLAFGNGVFGGAHDLVFSAGPGGEQHGLVGTISPR